MDERELYGLPREQFVAERNAWAKTLRADGRREEAARVAALRKPSVAAWTVNQLIRTEPRLFAELLEAGDALRAAQDRMLSGDGSAQELRDAAERERQAVDALVSAGTEQGMTGAVAHRAAGTLHAAALDEDARGAVRDGRLVEELQHVGFGGPSLATGAAPGRRSDAPPGPRPAPARRPRGSPASRAEAKHAEEREKAELRRRAEELTRARRAERDARRHLQSAERALAHAEQHHEVARAALRDAEDKLRAAHTEVDAAAGAHAEAQRALDSLSSQARRRG